MLNFSAQVIKINVILETYSRSLKFLTFKMCIFQKIKKIDMLNQNSIWKSFSQTV